jgi:hypothetical protein
MALQPCVEPWQLFQFLDLFIQSEGLLGRVISTSQDTQDNTNTKYTDTDIHVLTRIRTHDPSV